MCDFKPGDEVICIRMDRKPSMVGRTYIVETVFFHPTGGPALTLVGVDNGDPNPALARFWGHAPYRFRKVQRRDLQSWLKTSVPNTDHLDKPLPAKKREWVQ
ncbi:hypothetical protein [Brevundimonas sp. GCM10030266]|uniref:hypothetical protein n=1 Tax=Brevundimonas sp. GCM10030266 TaxID=3273386 RepID=UPI00361501B2